MCFSQKIIKNNVLIIVLFSFYLIVTERITYHRLYSGFKESELLDIVEKWFLLCDFVVFFMAGSLPYLLQAGYRSRRIFYCLISRYFEYQFAGQINMQGGDLRAQAYVKFRFAGKDSEKNYACLF